MDEVLVSCSSKSDGTGFFKETPVLGFSGSSKMAQNEVSQVLWTIDASAVSVLLHEVTVT